MLFRSSGGYKIRYVPVSCSNQQFYLTPYLLSALDIERELLEHPSIAEVAVVGVSDASFGIERHPKRQTIVKPHPHNRTKNCSGSCIEGWEEVRVGGAARMEQRKDGQV